ncbi:MAG TPA: glutathione S-transferase family protein [Azospirillaceae bacterium]|nr:glutathione S-transferase family protein [Azospirillaceae bacterium]
MSDFTLVIGNKSYSSWSLRPWLALRQAGIAFDEVVIPLRTPETKAAILAQGPAGKVPVLRHGDLTIWDSLAICEYVAELRPEAGLWPEDRAARAVARSVSAEMHSGFQDLRANLFMDLRRERRSEERLAKAAADIARVQAIWADCRARFGRGGPFLFGRFSVADCMYAPVTTRFTTWGVELTPGSRAYVEAVQALPAFQDWKRAALAEEWEIDFGPI